MPDLEEAAQVVRKFFRDLAYGAGMHPSVADKVADVIVGPDPKAAEDEAKEGE